MYLEIILTIITVLLFVFILEITKIRKLLKESRTSIQSQSIDSRTNEELYEKAKKIIAGLDSVSASLLQRKLRIGYARSAKLIDMLENDGIIGAPGENNMRSILKRLNR